MIRGRHLLALFLAVLASWCPRTAHAYCRKTTCATCPRDPVTGCPTGGVPIAWPGACVGYALEAALPRQVSLADAEILVAQAFGAWQSVECPGTGQHPSIIASSIGLVECSRHEYDRTGGNANVVLFREDTWPYPGAENTLGLTTTTYDDRTGEILDADIEINGTVQLSSLALVTPDGLDLLSILTHEAGHFFGLAHSSDPNSTMQPVYTNGSDTWRTLASDDIDGICAIYPPGRSAEPCTFVPHGGFASECALGVLNGGCSVHGHPSPGSTGASVVVGSLTLMIIGRMRGNLRRRASRLRPRPFSRVSCRAQEAADPVC